MPALEQPRKLHWENAWKTGSADAKSWFQQQPGLSLSLIEQAGLDRDDAIIDVGGGASGLVDALLENGFTDLTVLDISSAALHLSQQRLGDRAQQVRWITADITQWAPDKRWSLWHDRAVFHFLLDPRDRARYKQALDNALSEGGSLVLAVFAEDGPQKCSGLDVVRFSRDALCAELAPEFELVEYCRESHQTPMGAQQPFAYYRFRK